MPLDRTWYNGLVDTPPGEDPPVTGTLWDKAAVDALMDAIDAALATVGGGGGGGGGALPTLTPPVDGQFAWVNQGSASVVAAGGTIFLATPANGGSTSWRIRKKAAPATPYTITAVFLFSGLLPNYQQAGLLFRQASDGKLHVATVQGSTGAKLNSLSYANESSFNGVYLQDTFAGGRLVILRIADDGTNRICSVSPDGVNFIPYHTVLRTNHLTADEVGFGVTADHATLGMGVTLLSWEEG